MKKLILTILFFGYTSPVFSTVTLSGSATSYIQLRGSLQSGATFYVSSGTVNGNFYTVGKPDASFGCSGRMYLEPQTSAMAPGNFFYGYPCGTGYTEFSNVNTKGSTFMRWGDETTLNSLRGLVFQPAGSGVGTFGTNGAFSVFTSTFTGIIGPIDGGYAWPRLGVFTQPDEQAFNPNKKLFQIALDSSGSWTDYLSVTKDTTTISNNLVLYDTVWDDLQVQVSGVRLPAASAPTYTSYKGTEILTFGKTGTNTIHFNAQVPHRYKQGTDLEFHIHLAYPNNGAGGTVWSMTYSWANINGNFPGVTTTTKTITSPEVTDRHQLGKIVSSISASTMTISSILLCSLSRLGGDGEDTYDNDIYLVGLDFHYQIDGFGSREEASK